MNDVITEEQFDKLNQYDQMKYLWCPNCKLFYLALRKQYHLCGYANTVLDPRD